MKKSTWVWLVVFLVFLLVLGFFYRSKSAVIPGKGADQDENLNLDLLAGNQEEGEQKEEMATQAKTARWSSAPVIIIDENKDYRAILTTSAGVITIDLFEKLTPITVNNFVFLVNQGFYDGLIFHRVIRGFMIQSGCPNGDGSGGPGYRFADEPFEGQYTRGTVAMANSGPDTNGSQFFIMQEEVSLSPNYVIFGQVVDGLAVVDQIASAPVQVGAGGEASSPVSPVTIESIEIVAQ